MFGNSKKCTHPFQVQLPVLTDDFIYLLFRLDSLSNIRLWLKTNLIIGLDPFLYCPTDSETSCHRGGIAVLMQSSAEVNALKPRSSFIRTNIKTTEMENLSLTYGIYYTY